MPISDLILLFQLGCGAVILAIFTGEHDNFIQLF